MGILVRLVEWRWLDVGCFGGFEGKMVIEMGGDGKWGVDLFISCLFIRVCFFVSWVWLVLVGLVCCWVVFFWVVIGVLGCLGFDVM